MRYPTGIMVWTICGCLALVSSRCAIADQQPAARPVLELGIAEPLGTTGVCINGTIHTHGRPAEWYIEYGATSEFGKSTQPEMLPPRLTAYYHESWDQNAGGWMGGMSGQDALHHPAGGANGGFLRFSEPSGDDPNHVDGIGTLHLCKYIYPGLLTGANGTTMLSAGDPDFRNARVQLKVRGNEWRPNGSELVWWTQSQSNIERLFNSDWRRANWAYTGFSLTPHLASGKWETVDYRLRNDSTRWTYGGNNLAQNRPNYEYWPINESQRHLNNDFFHLLTFVDPANRPQGSIDFDELLVTYHNYSLLIGSNGGELIAAPGELADAATLTDGWRHGQKKVWQSAAKPTGPQAFVWKFAKPVMLNAVQIHQNLEHPSRTVEVSVSQDGQAWTALQTLELPRESAHGPNYAYAVARPEPTPAQFVKVAVTSGYQDQHWGLGEVEVFGTGASYQTDDEPIPVTADLSDLGTGPVVHYRLVTVCAGEKSYSAPARFEIPETTGPSVFALPASRITATTAHFSGRLNAMGHKTQFWFEYGTDRNYGMQTPESYGGLQITPRLAALSVANLQPGTKYHFRLVARNKIGKASGRDMTFTTAPAE